MDILKGNIKSIYFKYLIAAFGGTLIPCIYSVVDVAMVGKYHGPSGPAALAVFAPLWNIIYGLGLLAGIGGSVLFSTMRGSDEKNVRRSNEIFTASLFLGILFSVILEVFICCSNNKLFLFFRSRRFNTFYGTGIFETYTICYTIVFIKPAYSCIFKK